MKQQILSLSDEHSMIRSEIALAFEDHRVGLLSDVELLVKLHFLKQRIEDVLSVYRNK